MKSVCRAIVFLTAVVGSSAFLPVAPRAGAIAPARFQFPVLMAGDGAGAVSEKVRLRDFWWISSCCFPPRRQ